MTLITFEDGKPLMKDDGKIGTEQECCCQQGCCEKVTWHRVHGECNNLEDDFVTVDVGEECYAYYTWDDWSCDNDIVDRDCGDPEGNCNIFARVKVTATVSGAIAGVIEYLQSPIDEPEVWGPEAPGGRCDCPDSFGSLSVECQQCAVIAPGPGWYTENYKADFTQFLLDLGYTNVVFTPAIPFEGFPVPYTDGCGQTFLDVTYECCGTFDSSNSCDPPFVIRTLRDAAGAGNQNPPCNIFESEVFLWVCCTEEPPP
jgi:hypothetical protein